MFVYVKFLEYQKRKFINRKKKETIIKSIFLKKLMAELINDKKEIEKIINSKIKGKKLVFTKYYHMSIAEKGIEHKQVLEIFPQFDKVNEIEKEKLKYGDIGFELFYNLSGNTYFSIATCPKDNKLLIIHAVEYKRNLDKRLKKF